MSENIDKMKESIIDMAKDLGIEDLAKSHIDSIENPIEEKVPVIGEFKPKDKFIEFIGGKGYVNFISNEATIEAKYLSGLEMDNITFKLTICDEGTVNFEEIETNLTNKEQRGRLLDIISDKTIAPFRTRMVVQELQFMSISKINDKSIPLFLSVEYQKPIEKLASIFDEDLSISDEQSDKLDALMSLFDDEPTNNIQEDKVVVEVNSTNQEDKVEYTSQISDSFAKMKQDKIDELDKRLENKNKELSKFENDMRLSTKKVDDVKAEIELLESRLETLKPDNEPTGYYFNVSEMLNQKMTLETEVADFIKSKISKIKSINVEAFMKIFEQGEYNIRLGMRSEDTIVEVSSYKDLNEDIKEKLGKSIGIKIDDDKLIYIGDLSWGDLVNKLVKAGFEQESEFDKYCGSNSYQASQYNPNAPVISLATPIVTTKVDTDKIPVYHTHGNTVIECDVKTIDEPGDIRVAIYNKLGDSIKNYRNTSDLIYDIVGHIENWPNLTNKDENGNINFDELESLDCENNGLPELTSNHITISAGGDWQQPLTMTIKSDSDGKLWVTEYDLNYDGSCVKLDYLKEQISR